MIDRRQEILNATKLLIYTKGLQSVSMSQIAKSANVGMGTIYNYFATKEELVNQLFGQLAEALSDYTLTHYDSSLPVLKRLHQLCYNLLNFGINNPVDLLLFERLNHSPYIRDDVQNFDYGVKAAFFKAVQSAQSQGIVKAIPPVMLGNIQISYVAAIVRSKLLNGVIIDSDLSQQVADAWLDLLKQH